MQKSQKWDPFIHFLALSLRKHHIWRQVYADKTLSISAPSCAILVSLSLAHSLSALSPALSLSTLKFQVCSACMYFSIHKYSVLQSIALPWSIALPRFLTLLQSCWYFVTFSQRKWMTASCLGALALSPSVMRLSCALQFCMYVDHTHSITWAL